MSRIGKAPIKLLPDVKVYKQAETVVIEGPKGKLEMCLFEGLDVVIEKGLLNVVPCVKGRGFKPSFWGLQRSLFANMVEGVQKGFTKVLEIRGVGYKAKVEDRVLQLSLGYSHPVNFDIPDDIDIAVDKQNRITITGIDKQRVGQIAAQIRLFRKPDVYKGKGLRYMGEWVRHKAGKTGSI